MRFLTFCLTLAVWPGASQENGAANSPIVLYTHFEQQPPAPVWNAITSETDAILSGMRLHTEWRSLDNASGRGVAVDLAVVHFKGECRVDRQVPVVSHPAVLGSTYISDGSILPFADVNCEQVRGFLQRELGALHRQTAEELLGRALGRVVAHELYHVLAKTVVHAASGVAKAAFSIQDLVAERFEFREHELRELREGLAHGLAPATESVDLPL